MTSVRMPLNEAAKVLGIAPNSVRSRFKAGKLRGERDNTGKIWVWVDPLPSTSKPSVSNPSIEPSIEGEIRALQAHVQTLAEELAAARAELLSLRPKVSMADRMEAQIEGLRAMIATADQERDRERGRDALMVDDLRKDRDQWRDQAMAALADRRPWWRRLAG